MKKTSLMMLVVAAVLLSACGALQPTSQNNSSASATTASSTTNTASTAMLMGQTTGRSLDQLTTSYKSTGKVDMTNLQNVASAISLIGAAQQLYSNKSDSQYRQQFILGMVTSSINITDVNAETVTEQLTQLAEQNDLDQLQQTIQQGTATAESLQNTANQISSLTKILTNSKE